MYKTASPVKQACTEFRKRVFTLARDGFQKVIGGGRTDYKAIAQAGVNGRESRFRIPAGSGEVRTRMFFVSHRWYHVFAMGTPEFVNSSETNQFLRVLKVPAKRQSAPD